MISPGNFRDIDGGCFVGRTEGRASGSGWEKWVPSEVA